MRFAGFFLLRWAVVAWVSWLAVPLAEARGFEASASLEGHILIADESLLDPNFAQTVILILDHGPDGALGLVINRPLAKGKAVDLLDAFGLAMPENPDREREVELHYGGPVEPGRAFVLHSPEYQGRLTRPITDGVSLTSDPSVLADVATGDGPDRFLLILGYAGWAPGQIEGELLRGGWLVAPSDTDLIFDPDHAAKWRRAVDAVPLDL